MGAEQRPQMLGAIDCRQDYYSSPGTREQPALPLRAARRDGYTGPTPPFFRPPDAPLPPPPAFPPG